MKAVESSVYSAAAIGISWISSAGRIWSYCTRAPSGPQMEIYYWSQNRTSLTRCAHEYRRFITIYRAALTYMMFNMNNKLLYMSGIIWEVSEWESDNQEKTPLLCDTRKKHHCWTSRVITRNKRQKNTITDRAYKCR